MLKTVLRNVAFVALCAAAGALPVTAASSTTPDRSWLGVKRLVVLTEVRPSLSDPALTDQLCDHVKRVAARGAPFPVECAKIDDPALNASDAAVLLVQAAVQEGPGRERLLVFTARREKEQGLEPMPVLFGAAPRAVPVTDDKDRAALDAALSASLSEILPWLRPAEPGELSPIR